MPTTSWIIEPHGESITVMFPLKQVLLHTRSAYQEIMIAETSSHGKALFLDGIPQSSALDEHIYHEAIVHPSLVAHPSPRTVFVAGGGEGAILREILRHPTIERVLMVDIDAELIQIVKTHLPEWHQGAFDDSRVTLVHTDAFAYLRDMPRTYDCILMDLTDPATDSPTAQLYGPAFFDLVRSRLNPGGILAGQMHQTEIGWFRPFAQILQHVRRVFPHVVPYQMMIPLYIKPMGFAVASRSDYSARLSAQTVRQTLQERGLTDLPFYDAISHQHMFALPRYLRQVLNDPARIADLRTDQDIDVPT